MTPPQIISYVSQIYDIIEISPQLKTKLEALLKDVTFLLTDRGSSLKQVVIINASSGFGEKFIPPLQAKIASIDNEKIPNLKTALAEATAPVNYDISTGVPPTFPGNCFPQISNLATNADDIYAALTTTALPIYEDIYQIYQELLLKRSEAEAEKDISAKECFERLNSYISLQSHNESMKRLEQNFFDFKKYVNDLQSIKIKLIELARQDQALNPIGQSLKYCDDIAQKEVVQREAFDLILSNSPLLNKSFPGLNNEKKTNQVQSTGIEKIPESTPSPNLLEHAKFCYEPVKEAYTNIISDETIPVKTTNETLEKRKEECDKTEHELQLAQKLRGENGRKNCPEKIQRSIKDESDKVQRFQESVSMLNDAVAKQEEAITKEQSFYASLIGNDLLSEFRKMCEKRQGDSPSIKEQFLAGLHYNSQLQYELWTLKCLAMTVLDSKSSGKGNTELIKKAYSALVESKSNWDRVVSFDDL